MEGRLIAPPLTPEGLYLQDKRERDWALREQRNREFFAGHYTGYNPFERLDAVEEALEVIDPN